MKVELPWRVRFKTDDTRKFLIIAARLTFVIAGGGIWSW